MPSSTGDLRWPLRDTRHAHVLSLAVSRGADLVVCQRRSAGAGMRWPRTCCQVVSASPARSLARYKVWEHGIPVGDPAGSARARRPRGPRPRWVPMLDELEVRLRMFSVARRLSRGKIKHQGPRNTAQSARQHGSRASPAQKSTPVEHLRPAEHLIRVARVSWLPGLL